MKRFPRLGMRPIAGRCARGGRQPRALAARAGDVVPALSLLCAICFGPTCRSTTTSTTTPCTGRGRRTRSARWSGAMVRAADVTICVSEAAGRRAARSRAGGRLPDSPRAARGADAVPGAGTARSARRRRPPILPTCRVPTRLHRLAGRPARLGADGPDQPGICRGVDRRRGPAG